MWNPQANLNSAALNRQAILNDSSKPDLSVQGQAVNMGANRAQWGVAPRGTLLNALENAPVHNETMNSTDASAIVSMKPATNSSSTDRKNETYVIPVNPKSVSTTPSLIKPVVIDPVVEDVHLSTMLRPGAQAKLEYEFIYFTSQKSSYKN